MHFTLTSGLILITRDSEDAAPINGWGFVLQVFALRDLSLLFLIEIISAHV